MKTMLNIFRFKRNENKLEFKRDLQTIQRLIELVNKSPSLYVELDTVEGDKLVVYDTRNQKQTADMSMLGY